MARLAFDLTVLRVLLVEDDTFSRELEKTAFQHLGISTISFARDEADALDALARGVACDLIAFDWNTPEFDAGNLVRTIREKWPGIAILTLTNNEGLDSIRVAREVGVDGCLIKPFSLDKLREAIQLALIAKLTGGKPPKASATDPELAKIVASIQEAIASPSGDGGKSGEPPPESVRDAHRLAASLSAQLTGFVGGLSRIEGPQMDVIRLHVDCLQAVLSGRQDLLAHETRNLIVDGLNLAADMVAN